VANLRVDGGFSFAERLTEMIRRVCIDGLDCPESCPRTVDVALDDDHVTIRHGGETLQVPAYPSIWDILPIDLACNCREAFREWATRLHAGQEGSDVDVSSASVT